MKHLLISPRDPLIARDGRPFGAGGGNRMRPLPFLYPSVVSGSLRSYLGKLVDPSFPPELVETLRRVAVHGPLLATKESLYFPRALDAVFSPDLDQVLRLRPQPMPAGGGCDLPNDAGGLVGFDRQPDQDFKPGKAPAFWSAARMTAWLLDGQAGEGGYRESLPQDVRWHVQIDNDSYGAKDQRLFQTSGLAFPEETYVAVRFTGDAAPAFVPGYSPLGGERRLAHWEMGGESLWQCPADLAAAVAHEKRLRLVLATPGLFANGFLPGWLSGEQTIPGTNIRVALRGVCVDRWRAISGYSLDRSRGSARFGRKPVRRLVPAGAVYFLERIDDLRETFRADSHWLKPVSDLDEEVHRGAADGFGLALWGTWK